MQKEQQVFLKEQLSILDTNERLKLYKRASTLRKNQQSRQKPRDDERLSRGKSLDDFVLQILLQETGDVPVDRTSGNGTVIWLGPKSCSVRSADERVECSIPRSIHVAIGDRVSFGPRGDEYSIVAVMPRSTVLSRPDVDNGRIERVIAANVDVVVVVVSVIAPPLHPRLIDRYMIAIQRGGAKMLLAINKVDLLDGQTRPVELAKLEPYRGIVAMTLCSTTDGTGIDELRTMVTGQTCAFVGHSGVGKSSLINAFDPNLQLLTRSVSVGYGRGAHTTTASTLLRLADGTQVIDTPGVRSFGLWDIGRSELAWYFPEFEDYQSDCKFRNCTHSHEPACGVKSAVARGLISSPRYEAYMRILTLA
ncbi:MAG: ribosome small subunit-dependent GTPase A [Fimbriimonas sp.]|nr:ribosome small subunit-dependent GTPase A [Fimbriimonas sp.]